MFTVISTNRISAEDLPLAEPLISFSASGISEDIQKIQGPAGSVLIFSCALEGKFHKLLLVVDL